MKRNSSHTDEFRDAGRWFLAPGGIFDSAFPSSIKQPATAIRDDPKMGCKNVKSFLRESQPGLLTWFRSETAEMVLNARLATDT